MTHRTVLVINSGSSSIKYQLMDLEDVHHCVLLASGLVEKIGEPKGRIIHKKFAAGQERKFVEEEHLATHHEGMSRVVALPLPGTPSVTITAQSSALTEPP